MLTPIVSLLLGLAAVLQGGLNRKISQAWGLTGALLFNAAVLTVGALAVALIYTPNIRLESFRPWFVLAGFCGLTIVAGMPWCIARQGAAQTFLIVVAAQLAGSLIWDIQAEGIPATPWRILGALLAVLGATVAQFGRQ